MLYPLGCAISQTEIIMHNFASEQDWVMHCRIPSRRWKIRRIRTAHDKKLRKLEVKRNELWDEVRNQGYELLEKPIRCGYKRLFILTDDCKHTPNPNFYTNILDKINNIRYSPTKEFNLKRASKRWRRRKKRRELNLKEPNSFDFHNRMKFSEDEKRMFYLIKNHDQRINRDRYVFSEPWRFTLSTRPHWITEIKRKDSILEQQIVEVNNIIDQYKNQGRLVKMRGGNFYVWDKIENEISDRKKYSYNSLKDKPLYRIMEEYNEDKQL